LTKPISIENVSNVPAAPNGFKIYSAIKIKANNATNETKIHVNAEIPCNLTGVKPYILKNSTWSPITLLDTNASTCTVSFATIAPEPIIALIVPETTPVGQMPGLVRSIGPSGSTGSNTIMQKGVTASEQSSGGKPQQKSGTNYTLIVAGLSIAMLSIGLAITRSRILYVPDIGLSPQYSLR
jgi:hypothetical protein